MFKKLLFILLSLSLFTSFGFTVGYFEESTIYADDITDAINSVWIDDPLREWTTNIWEQTQWIAMSWIITTSEEAQDQTVVFIQKIVNYFLALLWLVALLYLIYHWILILTAVWDDTKYKKWLKWIQTAAIALGWIWFSRFIVSLILYVIKISAW
jgi:hypothetical protein